ncbi:hypothetical protein [Nocardia australiensis]|uniref:hypothetical protein n=1 Tax=Nocardia australiensis TaxID=2887191 RepID=UPI001D15559E|nr:hypothetical protein [Nocardia australiensis]
MANARLRRYPSNLCTPSATPLVWSSPVIGREGCTCSRLGDRLDGWPSSSGIPQSYLALMAKEVPDYPQLQDKTVAEE